MYKSYTLKYSLKGIGKVKKKKVKVWKDVDEVVKASSLKDKEKDIFKIMIEIPQGEKALKWWVSFIFLLKEVETLSLTTKQELFIQGLIKGYSQREAYKMAYEADNMKNETIDKRASELFSKGEIKGRYEELKNELKEKAFYTVEKANDDLNWIKLKAKEDIESKGIKQANANTYLGAVKQQIELNGITIKEAKADIDNIIKFEIVGAKNE